MTIIATRENGYLLLELNDGGNAFTHENLDLLTTWIEQAEMDRSVRSIILSSKTKVFSVGGHLNQMMDGVKDGHPSRYVEEIVPKINKVILAISKSKLPFICALNGTAAGGGMSLFLIGDYRISSMKGKLYTAFGDLALTPDSGSSVLMRHRMPKLGFMEFAKSTFIDSQKLLDLGGANMLCEPEELLPKAKEIAASILFLDPYAVSQSKKFANRELIASLEKYLEEEYTSIVEGCKRPEFQKRLSAVIEKLTKS